MALLNLGPIVDKDMKHGLLLTRDNTFVWQSDMGTPDEVVIYNLQLQANSFSNNFKMIKITFFLGIQYSIRSLLLEIICTCKFENPYKYIPAFLKFNLRFF